MPKSTNLESIGLADILLERTNRGLAAQCEFLMRRVRVHRLEDLEGPVFEHEVAGRPLGFGPLALLQQIPREDGAHKVFGHNHVRRELEKRAIGQVGQRLANS